MAKSNSSDSVTEDSGFSETGARFANGFKTGGKALAITTAGLAVAATTAALFNAPMLIIGGTIAHTLGFAVPAAGMLAMVGGGVAATAGAAGFAVGALSDDAVEKQKRQARLEALRSKSAVTQEPESDSKLNEDFIHQGREYALQAERLGLTPAAARDLSPDIVAPTNLPLGLGGGKPVRNV